MTPIATFAGLDEAESALDWIGIDFTERDGFFTGELAGEDRELLAIAIDDTDAPAPVRDLARALLARWDADGSDALEFAVDW